MFLFCNRIVFVILIIKLLILLGEDGILSNDCMTVAENVNSSMSRPFLQIEKHAITRLIITNPHLPHFLSCVATIDESYLYYQNKTIYYYTWFRNDKDIKQQAWRRNDFFVYRNGTLRLPSNERTSGVYRCKINANNTAVLSESITVEYPVLRRNAQVVYNISAFVGQPLTLDCPILSVPPANVSWYYGNISYPKAGKNNRRVKNKAVATTVWMATISNFCLIACLAIVYLLFMILSNSSLVLRQPTNSDTGRYKCLAQNQFAIKNHRQFVWTVTVKEPVAQPLPGSKLLPYLQNVTQYISQGGSLTLACHALSNMVTIEWWYKRTFKEKLIKLTNDSAEYQIIRAHIQEHDGYYTCATTHDMQTFRVIVTMPPVITEQLRVYEGLITGSVTFSCRANGNPKPTLSWYHNGTPLKSSYSRYINGNDLLIHSFDPDEGGIYQCFARNIVGENYTAGEIRYNSKTDQQFLQVNSLQNIRCYAHSFNTINVTFDNRATETLFIVHIVQNKPHRWITPFAPMKLNHTSYVIISSHLPAYRPFELITRSLFPTSEVRTGNKPRQQTILSSLRSLPVTCCTQGLLLHLVPIVNDTFVAWSQPEMNFTKYFVLQFSVNYTQPHPHQLLEYPLRGSIDHIELDSDDIIGKLTTIEPLDQKASLTVLSRAEGSIMDNEASDLEQLETVDEIFSVVVTANVKGVLLQNFTRIKLRVLIITTENENLVQDFRYVQWKIIENDTTDQSNTLFHLTMVESRMLMFHFLDSFNETCVQICHLQINFPYIKKEEPTCDHRFVENSLLQIRNLSPNKRYRLHLSSCESQIFYGQLDVQTLPDPPGTISNQRIIRHNGLKLCWDPPLQPNGRVHHYNILWTLGNITHEANVLECSECFYKFPNISETAKIKVTVRVVGETGVGAPVFLDLRNINHHKLDIERQSTDSEIYSGIAIGSVLSGLCVLCFALLITFQRRRLKAGQHGPTHLRTSTDINFGNLSNPGLPYDSAGGLSGNTIQQDCHEMQTLIPRSRYNIEILPESTAGYQTTSIPNNNANNHRCLDQDQDLIEPQYRGTCISTQNLSELPISSTSYIQNQVLPDESKAFFIPFKHPPPNAMAAQSQTQSSSLNVNSSDAGIGLGENMILPNSLPLVANVPYINACRSGSLSSSSTGSSNGSKKPYHTNFNKHSNSNDGICLLAEEESAATLTPTSDNEATAAGVTNGLNSITDIATKPTTSKVILNNNNAKPKSTATKLKDRKTSNNERQATISYGNTSIVPALESNKYSSLAHLNHIHRRSNVDPNG